MANRGVNKVILIGNLGQDPQVRYAPNGSAIANIALATSESWRDKNTGETKEQTEWHRVVLFGKLAEIAGEYLHKGSQVYIEGQLRTRKWIDQSGQDKYTTEVVVSINGTMQMLGSRSIGMSSENRNIGVNQQQVDNSEKKQQISHNNQLSNITQKLPPKQTDSISSNESTVEDFDDDIPF